MSNIGGLLGTAGGANGTGFTGPTGTDIQSPVTTQQAGTSVQDINNLIAALQKQGGLQAQTDVYNQLQNIAAGRGPNPAQAMLNQATAANTANQAALMAGQRGAAQNTGLIARQAAMQGAANQQQAVGQGATMQAQQSLNALGQAQGQANTMAGQQIGTQQAQEQNLLNAIAQQNNARVGMQSNLNNANAGLIGATMGQQASIGSSMSKGISSALMGGGAEGGMPKDFPKMAEGGVAAPPMMAPDTGGPLSTVGQWFSNIANMGNSGTSPANQPKAEDTVPKENNPAQESISQGSYQPADYEPGGFKGQAAFAEGGKVPALVSPGERYLPPHEVKNVLKGDKSPLQAGEKIPGTPKHPGNDYRNDTIPKTLDEGGFVIPNKILQGPNPHWEAMKFIKQNYKAKK